MIDVASLPNPYDFANPVSDPDLFIGRKQQLDEIRYYLDHAKSAPRPINLAILGHRASGKTSLMNMAALEAKKRGFCVVRVDLDEDDARHQLAFFFKLFDAIVAAACENGAFGGISGKTYDCYLDMVNSLTVPEDKTFSPFLFPIQYAKAMSVRNLDAPITDHNYRGDLQRISGELNRPVIILFDESNVLANSRIHLEKLRNIFMNTPGYMLVLTGTPSLFPVIDEVFSPIVRQFKKIEVKEFAKKDETAQCIRRPLEKIGINHPSEIFDSETLRDVREIHSLSGGRPYEIQLICHLLFRRVQEKRAHKMRLSFSVLEDVRKELETSQDISSRPLLIKIKSCTKDELDALHLLCACDGHGTFDQVWAIHYTFASSSRWTKESLNEQLRKFVETGIIHVRDEKISFAGDYFDRVYTKYFARESGAWVNITPTSVDEEIGFRFFILQGKVHGLEIFETSVKDPSDLEATAAIMAKDDPDFDVFEEGPGYIDDLYFFMVRNRERKIGRILRATLEFPWASQSVYFVANGSDDSVLEKGIGILPEMNMRAKTVGGSFIADVQIIPIVPLPSLVTQVKKTANEVIRKAIARTHMFSVWQEYVSADNSKDALLHAELALEYKVDISPTEANNLGYVFLINDDLERAEALFDIANESRSSDLAALASYNKAILLAKRCRYDDAIVELDECLELCTRENIDADCACLITITSSDGSFRFDEVRILENSDISLNQDDKDGDNEYDEEYEPELVSIPQAAKLTKSCLIKHLGKVD